MLEDFLIEETLASCHLHINLNLIQLSEKILQLVLEALYHIGA